MSDESTARINPLFSSMYIANRNPYTNLRMNDAYVGIRRSA